MRVGKMRAKKRWRQSMNQSIIRSLNSRVIRKNNNLKEKAIKSKLEMKEGSRGEKSKLERRGQKRDFFFCQTTHPPHEAYIIRSIEEIPSPN